LVSNGTDVITSGLNQTSDRASWAVNINPPLPVGTSISFQLTVSFDEQLQGPFASGGPDSTGTFTGNAIAVKNNVVLTPVISSPEISYVDRDYCSPSQTKVTTYTYTYNVTMTSGDVLTGTSFNELILTNPTILNGCVSTWVGNVLASTSSPVINGCGCCSVINNNNTVGIRNQTLQGDLGTPPTCATCQGQILPGTGIFLNMDLLVGGITCSGDGVGCTQNFRYSGTDPAGILTDDGTVSTYVCGIPLRSGIQQVRVFFQVPTSGSYGVQAVVYLNNSVVGIGYFNEYVSTGDYPDIIVNLYSPITINAGDTFKVVYTSPS